MEKEDIVKKHYSEVASQETDLEVAHKIALKSGYTKEELDLIPPEASLGLGCGNSVASSGVKTGEFVLDLGCGAGMDLFLSGAKVGPTGKAVGVDFSAEMVKKGTDLAKKYKRENVEFHHCPIDSMPFPKETFDVAISNCVLNLVPDKDKAFAEVFRVLKKDGGRFVVSDILLKKEPPAELKTDIAAVVGGIGRAIEAEVYKKKLEAVGFTDVTIVDKKRDLMSLYYKPGCTSKAPCCESSKPSCCAPSTMSCCGTSGMAKCDTSLLDKYDLNEYAMSCIVTARKK